MNNETPMRWAEIFGVLAAFLTAVVGLPIWTMLYLKWIVAYAGDFNPAGVLVWPGISMVLAIPFALVVAFVSVIIYAHVTQSGWRWYRRTIVVHLAGSAAIFVIYAFINMVYGLGGELPSVMLNILAIPVLCGPMFGPPSLAATLVYAFVAMPRD